MNARFLRNRGFLFALSVTLALVLILLSVSGNLRSLESVIAFPLTIVSSVLNQLALRLSGDIEDLSELRYLRQRVIDLEELVGQYQSEQIALREIQYDFNRMAALLNYAQTNETARYLAAEIIATETSGCCRASSSIVAHVMV